MTSQIQSEPLLHSRKQTAGSNDQYVNANKTEYMCFKQKGAISTLSGESLKLVDKFTYLDSNISSTENGVNIRSAKAWNAVDRQSIIRKFNLTDKIKRDFFQAEAVSILLE